jgi:Gluconate 2-dehydrogenase subunit 3
MKEGETKDRDSQSEKSGLTRREWMLRLGEAAVLVGVTGSLPEAQAKAAVPPRGILASEAKSLPPGLYEASSEHMAHALISDERFVKIPPGSETDYVRPHEGPYRPRFFSAEEFKTVTRLIELMLGARTGATQGGDAAKAEKESSDEIAEWIDWIVAEAPAVREAARRLAPEHRTLAIRYYGERAVRELETAGPQKTWREGLSWLDGESEKFHSKTFLGLPAEQQIELLDTISDARQDKTTQNAGTHLFGLLKRQTIRGFYTSRLGLKELGYKGNSFYVECPGCPAKSS